MISPLPAVSPLTIARRRCVGSAGPPVAIPLDGGATWHPRDGLVTHESLTACAAYVVVHGGGMVISEVPHPKAGESFYDGENRIRFYPAVRRMVEHTGPARIIAVGESANGGAGLSCAEEARLLEEARDGYGVRYGVTIARP